MLFQSKIKPIIFPNAPPIDKIGAIIPNGTAVLIERINITISNSKNANKSYFILILSSYS